MIYQDAIKYSLPALRLSESRPIGSDQAQNNAHQVLEIGIKPCLERWQILEYMHTAEAYYLKVYDHFAPHRQLYPGLG